MRLLVSVRSAQEARRALIGGADIIEELAQNGELERTLEEKLGPDYRGAAPERVVTVT